jgi:hypothetical protein
MKRTVSVLFAAAALTGAGLAPAPVADAAAAPTITRTSLVMTTKVVSTTGHHLRLTLDISREPGQRSDVVVTLGTPTGSEFHLWAFSLPKSVVQISDTGAGTVKATRTQMHGFGKLSITSRTAGSVHTQECTTGVPATATRNVALTGRLLFLSRSSGPHKWGGVGSATHRFAFPDKSKVTWTYDQTSCPAPPNPACVGSTTWRAVQAVTGGGLLAITGSKAGKSFLLTGNRFVPIPHTGGNVTRNDVVTRSATGWAVTTHADDNLTVSITSTTGTATIDTTSFFDSSQPCGTGSREIASRTFSGAYTNGATPLHLSAQIFGQIRVANGSTAGHVFRDRVVSAG